MSKDDKSAVMARIWGMGDYHKFASETQIVSEQLVVEANVRAGQKVLDVACGTGNTTIAAARRRADVTGIDVAPALIERAKMRGVAEGLEDIRYDVADAQTLPYQDGIFDCTLSTFGATFFLDQQHTIDELLRVTRQYGRIAITFWAEASLPTEFFYLGRRYNISPEGSDVMPACAFGRGDYLTRLLDGRAASVRLRTAQFEACHRRIDDYLDLFETAHGPTMARLAALADDAQRRAYRAEQYEILARYNRATDGSLACSFDYLEAIIVKA